MITTECHTKKRLTHRQILALPYLVHDPNVERACRSAGITKKTFYAWQKEITFHEEFRRLKADLFTSGMDILKTNVETACRRLVSLLDTENPSIVRQVANDIIGLVIKNREMDDIIRRLEALEEQYVATEPT